jgi:hypothetical protein
MKINDLHGTLRWGEKSVVGQARKIRCADQNSAPPASGAVAERNRGTFGISQTTISLILRGKTWTNLYDELVPDVSPETYRRILGYDPVESLRPENGAGKAKWELDKDLKLDPWTIHDLRRTFATIHGFDRHADPYHRAPFEPCLRHTGWHCQRVSAARISS